MTTLRPVDAAPAAVAIVVTRDGQILVCRRRADAKFLGGVVAFPGGRVETSDYDDARAVFGAGGEDRAFEIAALRELAEEAGVWLAGSRVQAMDANEFEGARAWIRDPKNRANLLSCREWLVPAGCWITPRLSPVRFETHFFLALVDGPCGTKPQDGECEWVRFESMTTLLERWERLEFVISPPTLETLRLLANRLDDAAARLRNAKGAAGNELRGWEAVPDIYLLPLASPTLPPATSTNAYIVGHERVVVIDPAPYDDDERAVLRERILSRTEDARSLVGVVLTHHHVDHIGAATWVAETFGVPIVAHRETARLLRDTVAVGRTLEDGDVIDLGRDAHGRIFSLRVLHTPGHAPGHVVLVDEREGATSMFVGDMVASLGTIIIDPSDGDMGEYIRQLERLHGFPPKVLFPAHGYPIVEGRDALARYIAHRRAREEKILHALRGIGRGAPADLLPEAYADTPVAMHAFAARSCEAHLLELVRQGCVVKVDGLFVASRER